MILKNISQLVTPLGNSPVKGAKMNAPLVINDAEIEIEDGRIVYVGKSRNINNREAFDCKGCAVIPGFVDSHTHLVFGGFRAEEFLMRQAGKSYMEIMQAGGGIISSVKATRESNLDSLVDSALSRLDELKNYGVTSVEIKSGYGLDEETELKQLAAINELKKLSPLDIIATYMGAHSVPNEYKGRGSEYIDFIKHIMLHKVKGLASFVDIFCEKNVFSLQESRSLLSSAREMGFGLKIHADEIVSTGGAELAAELGCTSAEHLLKASDEGIRALANSQTIATLLPLTAFCLKEEYADARRLIDAGAAVALATDLNPGSCFSSSVPLMIALAVIYMKMSIFEVITALTINGACALNLGDRVGSLEVGKCADILILKYPTVDFLAYHSGDNCVSTVFKNGKII